MCGIAGAVGAIDQGMVERVRLMMDAQAHRGPDDSGLFESGSSPGVAFGFRRLSIIDLSADGHQPMVDAKRSNAIVFNGEIYNYTDLKRELVRADEVFNSRSDTEVLLRAYGRWGKEAVPRLRGMFAFAIFDPERRQVLLGRDRLGIKPLYYAVVERPGGKTLLFASELRALLATDLFPRQVDPVALATYFWNGFVVGPNSIVRGISLLPAGTTLTVDLDAPGARPQRYWSLEQRAIVAEHEALANLQAELTTAARQHLVADVPLGVFLSGGVDSSAVAALAVSSGVGQIRTFHIAFEEKAFDESVYARSVANALGTDHSEFRLSQAHFCSELESALASLDQPTMDAINTYFVSKIVREAGFTVALAGTGGDELFGGYFSFRDVPRAQLPSSMSRLVPAGLLRRAARLAIRLKFGPPGDVPPQTRWGKLADVLATGGDALSLYQVTYGLFTRDYLHSLADESLLAMAPFGLSPGRANELSEAARRLSPLSAVSLFEISLFLGERLLRDTDVASMATSLEVRVPLLDHRVVEAVRAVPDAMRFPPLGKKQLLKSLGMPSIDPRIFDRPKSGFVLPLEVWAKDQLASDISAVFADRALSASVGLSSDALQRLFRAFCGGAPGLYWSRVWAPYVLLKWCQRHRVTLG